MAFRIGGTITLQGMDSFLLCFHEVISLSRSVRLRHDRIGDWWGVVLFAVATRPFSDSLTERAGETECYWFAIVNVSVSL
jgi:hypothetical protein